MTPTTPPPVLLRTAAELHGRESTAAGPSS